MQRIGLFTQVGYFNQSSIVGKLSPSFQNPVHMSPRPSVAPAVWEAQKENPEIKLKKDVLYLTIKYSYWSTAMICPPKQKDNTSREKDSSDFVSPWSSKILEVLVDN